MSVFVTEPKNKIIELKYGDPGFKIKTDIQLCDRAAIDIDVDCPRNVRETIIWAYNNGYLSANAYVTEQEYIFIGLSQ